MTPEKAVEKILAEMREQNLFPKVFINIMRMYAFMLISIGFNLGRRSVVRDRAIIQCDLFGNPIETFQTAREAEHDTKVKHQNISACCKGKINMAGGFIWKYKEN